MSLVTCLSVNVLRRLPSVQMSCRVLSQVHVLPFLQGKADQNRDDCSYKGLRRIAKPAVLETGVKPSGNTPSELKDQAKKRAAGSPCKGHEIEWDLGLEEHRGELHTEPSRLDQKGESSRGANKLSSPISHKSPCLPEHFWAV